jgi:hypothetical protein
LTYLALATLATFPVVVDNLLLLLLGLAVLRSNLDAGSQHLLQLALIAGLLLLLRLRHELALLLELLDSLLLLLLLAGLLLLFPLVLLGLELLQVLDALLLLGGELLLVLALFPQGLLLLLEGGEGGRDLLAALLASGGLGSRGLDRGLLLLLDSGLGGLGLRGRSDGLLLGSLSQKEGCLSKRCAPAWSQMQMGPGGGGVWVRGVVGVANYLLLLPLFLALLLQLLLLGLGEHATALAGLVVVGGGSLGRGCLLSTLTLLHGHGELIIHGGLLGSLGGGSSSGLGGGGRVDKVLAETLLLALLAVSAHHGHQTASGGGIVVVGSVSGVGGIGSGIAVGRSNGLSQLGLPVVGGALLALLALGSHGDGA